MNGSIVAFGEEVDVERATQWPLILPNLSCSFRLTKCHSFPYFVAARAVLGHNFDFRRPVLLNLDRSLSADDLVGISGRG